MWVPATTSLNPSILLPDSRSRVVTFQSSSRQTLPNTQIPADRTGNGGGGDQKKLMDSHIKHQGTDGHAYTKLVERRPAPGVVG